VRAERVLGRKKRGPLEQTSIVGSSDKLRQYKRKILGKSQRAFTVVSRVTGGVRRPIEISQRNETYALVGLRYIANL